MIGTPPPPTPPPPLEVTLEGGPRPGVHPVTAASGDGDRVGWDACAWAATSAAACCTCLAARWACSAAAAPRPSRPPATGGREDSGAPRRLRRGRGVLQLLLRMRVGRVQSRGQLRCEPAGAVGVELAAALVLDERVVPWYDDVYPLAAVR